jgi:hypothetical protein
MIYLIKIIFFLFLNCNAFANENEVSEILFKINNKVFTNVDLDKRTTYVKLINNFESSELNEVEINDILEDYISSLIFYEYNKQNKIVSKNLNDEVNLLYKKNFKNIKDLAETEIKNIKYNTKIDLIRNKIIEKELNLKKNILLQEVNTLDLLYNYNLKYLIIKENLIDKKIVKNIKSRIDFNKLKDSLVEKEVNFFFKEEDINDNNIISNKIKKIIELDLSTYNYIENGYIILISINKNLESYEGINVKLINFNTSNQLTEKNLQCDNLNKIIDANKTIFKEYEYSKLNNKIKNSLKTINDYIILKDNENYNYIILCDLTYDEKLLKNINFNKNVNFHVKKIQKKFLNKYKNEYNFVKIK